MLFQHLNKTLMEKKFEASSIQQNNLMYVYQIIFHEVDTHEIDFEAFTLEDVLECEQEFTNNINFEFDYAGEDLLLLDEHPFSVLDSLQGTIGILNRRPKVRRKSRFRFI